VQARVKLDKKLVTWSKVFARIKRQIDAEEEIPR
jgi:hypothetical protein